MSIFLLLMVGLACLYVGGEALVRGASRLFDGCFGAYTAYVLLAAADHDALAEAPGRRQDD